MYSKRTSRLTADITLDTHNLLREACLKYDAPKGKLLERMIINFCGDAKPATQVAVVKKETVKRTMFKPPTVEEVREYCDSRCNNVDPQNFVDHYTGNGWIRGKTKVKCWKACVRTWENKDKPAAKSNESLQGNW